MFNGNFIFLKRVFRRTKTNLIQLITIFFMIFITTTLFVGYFVGTSSVVNSIIEFNSEYNLESGHFTSQNKDYDNGNDIEKIEYAELSVKNTTIRIFKKSERINLYQITSGKDALFENQILLDNNYLNDNHLKIGEKIDLLNTEFEITGTAISPDYIMTKKNDLVLQPNSKSFGVGYTSKEVFDKYFKKNSNFYYAYTGDKSIEEEFESVSFVIDNKNDSKVKQVIGDAESPQKLSLVVVSLFYLITIILISIYFIEMNRKEKRNVNSLYNIGKSKKWIMLHYIYDLLIVCNIAWGFGLLVGSLLIKTVMYMNSSIYNYPILSIDDSALFSAIGISFLTTNFLIILLSYFNFYKQKNIKSISKFTLLSFSNSLPFRFRYRFTKLIRNYWETILYVLMIFITALLINFSLQLKNSVVDYVKQLDKETKYEYMYTVDKLPILPENAEVVKSYRLYDNSDILQTVYVVDQNSKYFDIKENKVVISKAFSLKYGYSKGDKIKLKNKINNEFYTFHVERVSDNSTVSEIYVNANYANSLESNQSYALNILSDKKLNKNTSVLSTLTKEEVVNSGENILNIINKQITMILLIAAIVEITLMYSLIRFIFENNFGSMKVFYLIGFSKNNILKFHFTFNLTIALFLIISSYFLSLEVVRIFLDNIMFTFPNYVLIIRDSTSFILTTFSIVFIYLIFVFYFKLKMNKEELI
ncbi:hypothetical protein HMPREF1045_1759 [Streptococcus mitis SK616]|nr:hypothetical protein HMPREF1045_1759 [Streptococcus mitis SK616]